MRIGSCPLKIILTTVKRIKLHTFKALIKAVIVTLFRFFLTLLCAALGNQWYVFIYHLSRYFSHALELIKININWIITDSPETSSSISSISSQHTGCIEIYSWRYERIPIRCKEGFRHHFKSRSLFPTQFVLHLLVWLCFLISTLFALLRV